MADSYHVHLANQARRDIRQSFEFIEQRSPAGAEAWYAALMKALQRVETTPLACGYAPENVGAEADIRQVLFSTRSGLTYRTIFTVVEREVRVLHIRGPGQDLLDRQPF